MANTIQELITPGDIKLEYFIMPVKSTHIDQLNANEAAVEAAGSPIGLKIGIFIILLISFSIAAFFIVKIVLMPKIQHIRSTKKATHAANAKVNYNIGKIYVLDDITVNLLGSGGRRIMVAEFAIEASNVEIINELTARDPQLKDRFIGYLRSQSAEDVLAESFQSESKAELTKIVNSFLISGEIDRLYYRQLILQ